MITVGIILIIGLPICLLIYKIAVTAWRKADADETVAQEHKKLKKELEQDSLIQNEINNAVSKPHREMERND